LHLQSYRIDPGRYNIIDSPGIDEEKDIKEIQELGGKLKKAFQLRAQQVREIKEVYIPIYEARLKGPKNKVGLLRLDAIRKKIL